MGGFSLADARRFVGMDEAQAREALGPGVTEDPESDYEGLDELLELNGAAFPGSVYLKDGRVVIVYIGDAALRGTTPEVLEAQLDGEPERLRSRAGKSATIRLHADQGVAYSADASQVHFVEAFPPTTAKAYRSTIYEEPPAFKR